MTAVFLYYSRDILAFSTPRSLRPRSSTAPPINCKVPEEQVEIRVCVNRSCGKQGSRGVMEVLSGLAPPGVAVSSCGCLGRCGAGPNLVVLPSGAAVGHCGTPARAANLLADLIGSGFDPRINLDALALRKKAEDELEKGNASEAQALLSQALDLKPSGGLQFLYRSRSAARLAIGDNLGAIEDAEEASKIDPKYPQVNSMSFPCLIGLRITTIRVHLLEKKDLKGRRSFRLLKESDDVVLSDCNLCDPKVRHSKEA